MRLNCSCNKITSYDWKPVHRTSKGTGAVTATDLVKNALRMRPERIIIGECRGGETLDMLQAMNTGHDGSMTTIHANTPRDAIARLETLVMMSGFELPVKAIRQQVSGAVDVLDSGQPIARRSSSYHRDYRSGRHGRQDTDRDARHLSVQPTWRRRRRQGTRPVRVHRCSTKSFMDRLESAMACVCPQVPSASES